MPSTYVHPELKGYDVIQVVGSSTNISSTLGTLRAAPGAGIYTVVEEGFTISTKTAGAFTFVYGGTTIAGPFYMGANSSLQLLQDIICPVANKTVFLKSAAAATCGWTGRTHLYKL